LTNKDKADIVSKEADIVSKKVLVLLASAGGSGSYAITQSGYVSFGLYIAFGFFVFGIVVNYGELVKLKNEIKGLKNG
jgi:hypothetical protein